MPALVPTARGACRLATSKDFVTAGAGVASLPESAAVVAVAATEDSGTAASVMDGALEVVAGVRGCAGGVAGVADAVEVGVRPVLFCAYHRTRITSHH